MRRLLNLALLICLVANISSGQTNETLDRIIAIVNNSPILLSDWYEGWRCEALLAGRQPETYSDAEQREIFDRLVDQELLKQQMHSYALPPIPASELKDRVQAVREQFGGKTDSGWQETLKRAGVTEKQLTDHVQGQMEIERFLEARFRPAIRIEDRSVKLYYEENFLPKLHAAGAKDVPLDEVSGKIREILVQERMSEQVSAWVQSLREQADIRIPPAIDASSDELEVK